MGLLKMRNRQHYEDLVYALEGEAERSPRAFRSRVMLVSVAAYLCLGLVLAGLLVLVGYGIAHHRDIHSAYLLFKFGVIAIAVLGLLFVVLRAFLTPLDAPAGREIDAAQAPRLFEVLEGIRRKLGGPPIHRVVVDASFNAAIAQVPRFGLFGGHRNHLILGLPYLFGMSAKEMTATLAHEYGHLVGDHGRFGAWVYRQRRTFGAMMDKLETGAEDNFLNRLLHDALSRFAPYYNAYTFVMSRQQEYEADAMASRVAGADGNASGLVRGELLGRWIAEEFWPQLYAQAAEHASPRFRPFASMRTAFAAGYPAWATRERLREAQQRDSGLNDTHPCLRDRLAALDRPAQIPPPVERSAADVLMGELAPVLVREFDAQWWEDERADWLKYHHRRQDAGRRIVELEGRGADALNAFELFELAQLQVDEGRATEAMRLLHDLLRRPGGPYPNGHRLLGELLLKGGDPAGLEQLKKAAGSDSSQAEDCARMGYWFLMQTKGEAEADAWVAELPNLPGYAAV